MKIALIGAGWLGMPLSLSLQAHGHDVVANSRQPARRQRLARAGMLPVNYSLGQALPDALGGADLYIINIAAGRRNTDFNAYVHQLRQLADSALASRQARMIFISTTAVYGGVQGAVDLTTEVAPVTPSAYAHCQIENHLRRNYGDRLSILRLAGLCGGDRHPVHYLAGRHLSQGQHPVNLVHRDDVIAAIIAMTENAHWPLCLPLCSLEHPSREAYYSWAAAQLGLAAPSFDTDTSQGRWIQAQKSWQILGISPRFTSPYQMLTPPDGD